jgi:hypothetical protein
MAGKPAIIRKWGEVVPGETIYIKTDTRTFEYVVNRKSWPHRAVIVDQYYPSGRRKVHTILHNFHLLLEAGQVRRKP